MMHRRRIWRHSQSWFFPFSPWATNAHADTSALRAGGHDNGAPGLRPVYGADYNAAFVTDPDGYRIEAY